MPSSLDEYRVMETIGKGSFGVCRKIMRRKEKRIFVWKEMFYGEMSEGEKQQLVSEVNLLRELRHRHIVRYYDRIIDRNNMMLYLVMEYCRGGDLSKLIIAAKNGKTRIEEGFIWKVAAQMISALKYCHTQTDEVKKIMHRDLKPANVFLDARKNVKLGDFGLARVLSHDTSFAKTFVGTPYYMSPEQMNFQRYNEKSDIWSLGCILYELCALRPPFMGQNAALLARNICTGLFPRISTSYSADIFHFISAMLKVDESKRPSINELHGHSKIMNILLQEQQAEAEACRPKSAAASQEQTEEELAKQWRKIERKEQELTDREFSITDKEQELSVKEKCLERREKLLIEREDKLEREKKRYETKKRLSMSPYGPLRALATENTDSPFLRHRQRLCSMDKENDKENDYEFLVKQINKGLGLEKAKKK